MQDLKEGVVLHLCQIAEQDKAYAWWAAKQYATFFADWLDIPALLTVAMRKRAGHDGDNPSQTRPD
jgi:hypothetical protein